MREKIPKPPITHCGFPIGTNHLEFLIRDANNQAQVVASNFTIVTGQWIVAAF
ncbi:MAG: hypothetical protein R3C26_07575 [Calditrichia bacterium]